MSWLRDVVSANDATFSRFKWLLRNLRRRSAIFTKKVELALESVRRCRDTPPLNLIDVAASCAWLIETETGSYWLNYRHQHQHQQYAWLIETETGWFNAGRQRLHACACAIFHSVCQSQPKYLQIVRQQCYLLKMTLAPILYISSWGLFCTQCTVLRKPRCPQIVCTLTTITTTTTTTTTFTTTATPTTTAHMWAQSSYLAGLWFTRLTWVQFNFSQLQEPSTVRADSNDNQVSVDHSQNDGEDEYGGVKIMAM